MDDVRGGELAGLHLIDIGASRIAYVGGPDWIRQCTDRHAGLVRATEQAKQSVEILHVRVPALTWRAGYEAVPQLMDARPDALFCANDVVAIGVLRGLIERKVHVPKDIAIVGYDDIDFASSSTVPLSSIRQPAYQIGKTSASLLLEEATSSGHAHQQVLFRPELIARASTKRLTRGRTKAVL